MTRTLVFSHGGGRLSNQLFSHANLLAFCMEHQPRFGLINLALEPYLPLLQRGANQFGRPSLPLASFNVFLRMKEDRAAGRLSFRHAVGEYDPTVTARVAARRDPLMALARAFGTTANYSATDVTGVGNLGAQELCTLNLASPDTAKLLGQARTTFLSGWHVASMQLIKKHRTAILQHLSFRPERIAGIASSTEALRRQCDVLIGVHIRRGDYQQFYGGEYFYSIEDYKVAMGRLSGRMPDRRLKFVICSDERFSAEQFLPFDCVTTSSSAAESDLTYLSACDLILAPPSSFSRWAAYLGDKPMVILLRGINPATVPYSDAYSGDFPAAGLL